MNSTTPKSALLIGTIQSEIAGLSKGDDYNWGRMSRLLLSVKETGFWKRDSNSFSSWVNSNLDLFKVKRASAWRYLTAGQFYLELKKEFRKFDLQPLEDLSSDIGPEKLELLSKISRVAPEETFKSLAEKLLLEGITRPELLSTWGRFKFALNGQTARGRGVAAPKANKASERVVEAVAVGLLANTVPDWTGMENITIHKTFQEVCDWNRPEASRFDAVVAIQQSGKLLLHGIEIKGQITPLVAQRLKSRSTKCDLMWLLLTSEPKDKELNSLPENAGVMFIKNNSITVIREAKELDERVNTEWLARQLLARSLC